MKDEAFQELFDLEENYWWFVGRRRIAFRLLDDYLDRGTESLILDAGCGTGINIIHLNERYGDTIGADISSQGLDFCRERGITKLVRASIEELPFKDSSIPLVACFGVIYHKGVKDVNKALRELYRVCESDGNIIVTTPAFEFLRSRHDIVQETARRFSLGEFRREISSVGFKIRKITYWTFFLFPFVFLARMMLKIQYFILGSVRDKPPETDLKQIPGILNRSLIKIMILESHILREINFPFGVSLLCIGKK